MKNVHVLPIDKQSRLWRNNLLQGKLEISQEEMPYNTAQNIHITNNEEIKEGIEVGAKWQKEQILDFLYSEITERRDYSASKMCEKVIEFIEQFKKK